MTEMRKPVAETSLYAGQKISVIIPYYNEEIDLLRRTLVGVLNAKGNKEVIVVDDGSPDLSCAKMLEEEFKGQIIFARYEKNRGKRQAQAEGFNYVTGEFLVTIDSDAVIEEDALIKLIDPLIRNPIVGATTGNIYVLNRNDNALTRMIAARYWNAFNVERKSLSHYGIVTCCSGVLSAYRTTLFHQMLPQYIGQKFLGVECTYGDDRHLTNLILREGYRIHYVEEAKCYTAAPTTMKKFVKQQLRWKKSFLRESLISLSFAFKHSILLPVEVLFNLIVPFWSLAIRLALIASMVMNPSLIPVFIASVVTVAVIRNFFLFFEDKELAIYSVPYAFIHEFVLFWLYFVAAFQLRGSSWGTR
jgi:cellulose synthase/poly-beta-1,6-N-acetylglucosamine synthase-like glycosyltransferase